MKIVPSWKLLTIVSAPPTRMKSMVIPANRPKIPTMMFSTARMATPAGGPVDSVTSLYFLQIESCARLIQIVLNFH